MLGKIKEWPQLMTFTIGFSLVLIGCAFTYGFWIRVIGGIIISIGFLFIMIAFDRIHINKIM
jgi:hypothetical protein